MFSDNRVLAALLSTPDGTAADLIATTVDAVTQFARGTGADDDVTLLALRVA